MATISPAAPSEIRGELINSCDIHVRKSPFRQVSKHRSASDNDSRLEGEDDVSDRLFTIPNVLTLSRLPLAIVLFACIHYERWLIALVVFLLASITDWLDGFLARKLNQGSALGRNLDPLIDKVLTGGAFIYLMRVDGAELTEWMVTVVI